MEKNSEISVLVSSESEHKLGAVKKALKNILVRNSFKVVGVKASSDINEQPEGYEETLSGANNRLKNTIEIANERKLYWDYIVSIESGIESRMSLGGEEEYFDFAIVIIKDKNGKTSSSFSAGVKFPKRFVDLAREKGFENNTVGKMISEETGTDKTDPHYYLTNNQVRRADLLTQAIKIAFTQLSMNL